MTADARFRALRLTRGEALYLHALFEALSEAMTQQGNGAGWHGWPDEFRHPTLILCAPSPRSSANWSLSTAGCNGSPTASSPRRKRAGSTQACASASISTSPWASRRTARPPGPTGPSQSLPLESALRPDYFNANGQDWGLRAALAGRARGPQFRTLPRCARCRHPPCRRAPHRPRDEPLPALLDRRGL